MDFSENSNWQVTKMLSCVVGLWPFQSPIESTILSSITIILLEGIFLPEIFKLVGIRENIHEVVNCLPMLILHTLVNIKIFNSYFQLQTMKLLLNRIRKDWQSTIYQSGKELLKNDLNSQKKIINLYMYILYGVTLTYLFIPMVPIVLDYIKPLNESRTKLLLYQTEFFIDAKKYAVPLYLYSCIVTPIPMTIFIAFDSMYANSVHHACDMFNIIRHRFQFLINSVSGVSKTKNCLIPQVEIHTEFINCLRIHNEILEFITILESNYTIPFFLITAISTVSLSIVGYMAFVYLNDINEILRLVFFMNAQLIHSLFRCWFGQKLLNISELTYQSIYQSKWYDLPPKVRKLLIIILIRGCRRSQISAGKIYILSMEHFASVLKASMSYFTVLRSMQ